MLDVACAKLRAPSKTAIPLLIWGGLVSSGASRAPRLMISRSQPSKHPPHLPKLLRKLPELVISAGAVWAAVQASHTEDWDKSESTYRVVRAALGTLWYGSGKRTWACLRVHSRS